MLVHVYAKVTTSYVALRYLGDSLIPGMQQLNWVITDEIRTNAKQQVPLAITGRAKPARAGSKVTPGGDRREREEKSISPTTAKKKDDARERREEKPAVTAVAAPPESVLFGQAVRHSYAQALRGNWNYVVHML